MKKRTRLAALALAIALCANLVPLQVLAEGEGDPSGDDSSTEFVGAIRLEEIFNVKSARPGWIQGNQMHLADTKTYRDYSSVIPSSYTSGTYLPSSNYISMDASWELSADFIISDDSKLNFSTILIDIYGKKTGYVMDARAGKNNGKYLVGMNQYTSISKYDGLRAIDAGLTAAEMTSGKTLTMKYNPVNRAFTLQYGSRLCSYVSSYLSGENLARIAIQGDMNWYHSNNASISKSLQINGVYKSAQYTHYTPQFVSTELLDEDGNTMTDEEKLALQDGDVVTVRATVKNTHPDAGKEIVYDHLTLVPEDDEKVKKYPTAGLDILTGAEQTVTVDGKAVTNASGQPYDVSGEGIPFGCTAAGNVITYKAKINNPDGKSVTVGQRMSDDFFGSKQYSSAELIPAQPLVPADPEKPAGEAGKDYHYTRTSPNENGWNNSDVAITFYPGDFNQFYIKDPEEGTVHATLTSEKEPLLYTDETETPVALQAENSESGAKSVRNDDVIKVDKVPPTLTAASPAPALFGFRRSAAPASAVTLADNLSGIWKLERYDAASKEWVAAETFDLPTEGAEKGNGKASESATIDQNGLYRAVDAAGNVGEPTPVSFNAPPSVTPTDPEAPELEPEEETDGGGLRHAVASDSMSEYIDKAAPLYGGRFTLEDAAELMAQRYGFASNVERDDSLSYTYAITQKGADVSGQGVDTTQAGSFVVVCTATDADGNTTTLYLTDTLIDPDAPPLVERQEEGTPPVGPPFDPLKPVPQPVIKEDTETGRYHAYVYEQIAEGVKSPGSTAAA
ncbi:hypothetical protein [Bittarella massiliensis (ex Durand et al. 2017)]|uniref:hypothetical protein n=1 Tax=Bittarella massiliensis (ex Durand et al. 2017) TaxID=1720313 RepID=UPI00073E9DB7|nr:hypothetical protein [Bittarella massiliensis (ex Durand et al. 2017)]